MAGAEGWQDIQLYGESKEDWLRQYRPFKNGIPKRHTIARILKSVVAESLLEALLNWVNEQQQTTGKPVIALDGKVLRGSYRGGKTSIDTSYYVSSMSPKNKVLDHYIRQHYVLDVVFKEDSSRICLDGAVENMALFRRFIMNMLKQCECGLPPNSTLKCDTLSKIKQLASFL